MYRNLHILIYLVVISFNCVKTSFTESENSNGVNGMEYIDILLTKDNFSYFTVDTSVDFVLLNNRISTLVNANNLDVFVPGDSFEVLSIGVNIPYGFSFYYVAPDSSNYDHIYNNLTYERLSSVTGTIDKYWQPFNPYEMSIGMFYDIPKTFTDGYKLKHQFTNVSNQVKVSMLNVPSVMHGKIIPVHFFIKIRHTFQMAHPS